MKENNQYVINKDCCPRKENIFFRNQCEGCDYYRGFEMYRGQPSVMCSFYVDIENDKE